MDISLPLSKMYFTSNLVVCFFFCSTDCFASNSCIESRIYFSRCLYCTKIRLFNVTVFFFFSNFHFFRHLKPLLYWLCAMFIFFRKLLLIAAYSQLPHHSLKEKQSSCFGRFRFISFVLISNRILLQFPVSPMQLAIAL